MRDAREGGFTELEEFTHILTFFVASIMVLVAAIHLALDKLDLTPSVQSYDILLIESVGGVILVFAYAFSRVVRRGVR